MEPSPAPTPAPCLDSLPSEEDLVDTHLLPWVSTGRKTSATPYVHEYDIYTEEPDALAEMFQPAVARNGDRAWYFLTKLRSKLVAGSYMKRRVNRVVDTGAGGWRASGEKPVVVHDRDGHQRKIAWRNHVAFKRSDERLERTRPRWIMAEYRLAGGEWEDKADLLVLCKVYRSTRGPGGGDSSSRKVEEEAATVAGGSTTAGLPPRHGRKADSSGRSAPTSVVAAPSAPKRHVGERSASPRKRKATDDADMTYLCLCAECALDMDVVQASEGLSQTTEIAPRRGETVDSSSEGRDPTFYNFMRVPEP